MGRSEHNARLDRVIAEAAAGIVEIDQDLGRESDPRYERLASLGGYPRTTGKRRAGRAGRWFSRLLGDGESKEPDRVGRETLRASAEGSLPDLRAALRQPALRWELLRTQQTMQTLVNEMVERTLGPTEPRPVHRERYRHMLVELESGKVMRLRLPERTPDLAVKQILNYLTVYLNTSKKAALRVRSVHGSGEVFDTGTVADSAGTAAHSAGTVADSGR